MKQLTKPILMILGVIICLAMLRVGVWQLERAEQKQVFVDQLVSRTEIPAVRLQSLITQLHGSTDNELRFRQVAATGRYAPEKSVYIDNKVVASQVGYYLLTPFHLQDSDWWVLVHRGWISAGATRAVLPAIQTPDSSIQLSGRLNTPPPPPPLWNDEYPVADGAVWQYLSMDDYAAEMHLKLLPLVLELAPDQTSEIEPALIREWAQIDDQWVSRHQAYAFQWFAMAFAFSIACLILILRSFTSRNRSQ